MGTVIGAAFSLLSGTGIPTALATTAITVGAQQAFKPKAPKLPDAVAAPVASGAPPPVTQQEPGVMQTKLDTLKRAKSRRGFVASIKAGETGGFGGKTTKLGGGS